MTTPPRNTPVPAAMQGPKKPPDEEPRIQKKIAEIEKEIQERTQHLATLEKLLKEFPDLDFRQNRWGTVKYMAKSANSRVDKVHFARTCGCCSDAGYLAQPYLEIDGTAVYSNPHNIEVGQDYDYRVQAKWGWEKPYVEAGISPVAIQVIRDHLASITGERDDDNEDDRVEEDAS